MGSCHYEEDKMTQFDIYVFVLCFLVFSLFTALFSALLTMLVKLTLKAVKHGLDDERITTEYYKEQEEKPAMRVLCNVLSGVVFALILGAFLLSFGVRLSGDRAKGSIPTPQIVLSNSMAYKNEHNTYLEEKGLDDQFATFDLIFTHELPGEFELELYDIVVYEWQDQLIIHRIVGIEEPNEKHPDHRYFLLRGDSSRYSDEFPVLYEQMRAIYRGDRIAFVGSFFAFMQSPAGYLCIILVLFALVATPIIERKLNEAKRARLIEIGVIVPDPEPEQTEGEESR